MTYYYSSLFKKSDVRITGGFTTTHKALDLSRGVVNSPIYSPNKLGAGTVTTVYTSYSRAGVEYKNSLVVWIKYDIGISMALYHGEVRHQKVKVGDRIQVGQQIYVTGNTGYSKGDHLHIELWKDGIKMNPSTWVINDNVPVASFKVGDKVEFTDVQNIMSGAGDKFEISRSTKVGEIATIKDGSRTSQNELFKKGANDSYIWWDMIFSNGTGWVADVSKFKIYTTPPVVIPPVEEPTQPTPLEKCQETLNTLQTEIKGLKEALRVSEERTGFLESTMAIREKEYSDLESDYQRILKERNTFEADKLDLQEKLDKLTQEQGSHWLEKFRDDIFEVVSKYKEKLIKFFKKE